MISLEWNKRLCKKLCQIVVFCFRSWDYTEGIKKEMAAYQKLTDLDLFR